MSDLPEALGTQAAAEALSDLLLAAPASFAAVLLSVALPLLFLVSLLPVTVVVVSAVVDTSDDLFSVCPPVFSLVLVPLSLAVAPVATAAVDPTADVFSIFSLVFVGVTVVIDCSS